MKLRTHLEVGYKTYTGKVITKAIQVQSYNQLQDRINSFIVEGREIPEELLNGSHNLFVSLAARG